MPDTRVPKSHPLPRNPVVITLSIGECAAIGQRALAEEIVFNFSSPFVSLWKKIRSEMEGDSGILLKLATAAEGE